MFSHKTPLFVQKLFPKLLWRNPEATKTLYLTFDDGPVPQATPVVLHHLQQYGARATFFCVGENIKKYPAVFEQLLAQGHAVGNHTYNHLNGWHCSSTRYQQNVEYCQQQIQQYGGAQEKALFRPPYGRLTFKQLRRIRQKYRIVMWDVLSGDFSAGITPQRCLQKSIEFTDQGSIVVFHDSIKTLQKINWVLPEFLKYFSARGYTFKTL